MIGKWTLYSFEQGFIESMLNIFFLNHREFVVNSFDSGISNFREIESISFVPPIFQHCSYAFIKAV